MKAKIVKENSKGLTMQINFEFGDSMLDTEENIMNVLNEAGAVATEKALARFDSDGTKIRVGDQVFTSKGRFNKDYQTPYGKVNIQRYIYQSQTGGKTFCPLEENARIIITSTPKFAKMVSSKYAIGGIRSVKKDLSENHNRHINSSTLQDISEAVGTIALAKETSWKYVPRPKEVGKVASIAFGLDGACMRMKNDGWREAMTGTIALYNKKGERMHTTYIASPPEYGKEKFLTTMEDKIKKVKKMFPSTTVGVADGAKENWSFLNDLTDYQVLDFYHATEHLGIFSNATIKKDGERKEWMNKTCHNLKHKVGAATRILNEIKTALENGHGKNAKKDIHSSVTYFSNNLQRMKYKQMLDMNLPIGSGVTEAGCKVIIKERMCKSGIKWLAKGAGIVLKLRCMNQTDGHWGFFWEKINRSGIDTSFKHMK